jgi:hypothetical protein
MKEVTAGVMRQLAAGKSQELVIQQLIERGWPEVSARHFVANAAPNAKEHNAVENGEEREVLAELYRRRMIRDVWLAVVSLGLMLAVVNFFPTLTAMALFFLSMTVFSFIDFVVALLGWTKNRS